jgi:hypothetical protein
MKRFNRKVRRMHNYIMRRMNIKSVMIILCILFIIPTFINYEFDDENRFAGAKMSLPCLYAGDQVHYYIFIYSLLKDHDIDVRNNYDSSLYNHTYDMGSLFRGKDVGRQAGYFNFKTRNYTSMWVQNTTKNIGIYGQQDVLEGTTLFKVPDPGKEYAHIMIRPLGMPIFYAVLLVPFSFLENPEPIVIFISVFLSILGIYFFYLTLDYFLDDERISAFFALLLGISSEIWMYSKLFYPDVIQFFLLSFAVYLFIVKKSDLLVGILFAIGVFARPTFILFLPFFFIYRLLSLDKRPSCSEIKQDISMMFSSETIKKILLLTFPVVLIILVQLCINYYFFGGFFTNPDIEVFHFKNTLVGLWVSFFKLNRGLFIFSPIMVFSLFGIREFYKKNKMDALLIYSLPVCFILFFSSTFVSPIFSDTYSIRYYLPIIPYFFIPLAFWFKRVTYSLGRMQKNIILIILFYAAVIVSILINFQAAIFHTLIWEGPPWQIVTLFIENGGFSAIKSILL